MLDERNLKLDLFALGLLALSTLVAIALATYDPADPPASLVYPPAAVVQNACGRTGALVANWLFEALGLGAYYLVVSLAVLGGLVLARRPVSERLLRGVGWCLSLMGFATFAAMALAPLSPGPVIGAGGYLGASGRGLLEMHFATAGAYILVVSLMAGGLLLATDYLLVRLSACLFGVPARRLGRGLARVCRAGLCHLGDRQPKNPPAGQAKRERPSSTLQVRIAGRSLDPDDVDLALDEEQEVADEFVAAAPRSQAASADPEGPADPVRVKPPATRDEREEVMDELDAASRAEGEIDYELPPIDLLLESEPFAFDEQEKEVRRKAKILEKTFASFGFNIKVVEIETGPVIAQFEVELEAGLRLSRITGLADDLAIALRVPSVRIVAPIPGKNTVGIEVPNAERQIVRLREVIEEAGTKAQKMRIPLYLGKDVAGNPLVIDLATLPHLLIAGRTGTGKSVCLNTIIASMLMTRRPDEVRMLLVDPKMVELSPYKTLPHLMHPVVTDMRKAEAILAWAVDKMEERYALLARAGVRHIASYNQLGEEELMDRLQPESDEERKQIPTHLPYIVMVADEMADLMMTAAKEVETHIIRLAQKSRAVGIHLVLATQKPTVDIITGLIKSNLPARISFQVASRTDSRVVLDEMGADKLLGNGDLLFLWPGTSTLVRGQGTYVSDDEISRLVDFVGTSEPQFVKELVLLKATTPGDGDANRFGNRDELYEAAVDIVVREGRGSVSLLQRALGIGYGRGARLIDFMAEDGVVGAYNGSQAREVLITLDQWSEMIGQKAAAPELSQRARNKILPEPDDEPRAPAAYDDEPSLDADDPEDLDDAAYNEEEQFRDKVDQDEGDEPDEPGDQHERYAGQHDADRYEAESA